MLQMLRDRFPRWLAIMMLGLLIILLAFLSLINYQESNQASNPVIARLNGRSIRKAQLKAGYERLVQQQQAQLGTDFKLTPSLAQKLQQQALAQLIQIEVLAQWAQQQGYVIGEHDIAEALCQIPLFQSNGQFSLLKFREFIATVDHTEKSFLAALEKSMLINQAHQGICQSAFVLPSEIDTMIRLLHQKRNFNYLIFSAQDFLEPHNAISPQAALTYYQENRDQFYRPEQISIEYIELDLSAIKAKLRHLHPQWTLTQITQEAEQEFSKAAEILSHLSYTHPLSLTETAKALKLALQATAFFDRTNGNTPITQHPEVVANAFSTEVLQGYNSSVISIGQDKLLVLRIKQYQAASLLPFESVQAAIQKQLAQLKASQKARQQGKSFIKNFKQTKTPLATSLSPSDNWHKVQQATRYGTQAPSAIMDTAFRMPRPQGQISIQGLRLPSGDYAVIHLLDVQDGDVKQVQGEIYKEQLAAELGQFDYALYTAAALRRAKVDSIRSL